MLPMTVVSERSQRSDSEVLQLPPSHLLGVEAYSTAQVSQPSAGMPDQTSYSLLASSSPHDSVDHLQHFAEDDALPSSRAQRSVGLSDMTCWRVLVFSCVAALILSTVNLLSLSARATKLMAREYSTYMQPRLSQLRQPSVYLGLENIPVNPLSCRSRGTFPRRFYTYDANSPQPRLVRVHGPDDKTTITFGGSVRMVPGRCCKHMFINPVL